MNTKTILMKKTYLQTTNEKFLDMILTAKHLEGGSDKTICYYRCNIEKMLKTINNPVIKIITEMLLKYLVEYQSINRSLVNVKISKNRTILLMKSFDLFII